MHFYERFAFGFWFCGLSSMGLHQRLERGLHQKLERTAAVPRLHYRPVSHRFFEASTFLSSSLESE